MSILDWLISWLMDDDDTPTVTVEDALRYPPPTPEQLTSQAAVSLGDVKDGNG